jgi:transcription-repair coupling factor (superfamily II helicase)
MNVLDPTAPASGPTLTQLTDRLATQHGFETVVASLLQGHGATLGGIWGSSCALAAAALATHTPETLVVVCPHVDDLDDFVSDLALFTSQSPSIFSPWEASDSEKRFRDEIYGQRLALLKELGKTNPPRLLVTSIQALMQPVPRRERLRAQTRAFHVGDDLDVPTLLRWLAEQGFSSTTAVELPGEFSHRGGILDIFAPDWLDPVRIELFGDQIESIRRFEISTQRSLGTQPEMELTALTPSLDDREHFVNYLPSKSWLYLVEPGDLNEEGRRYLDRCEKPDEFFSVSATLNQLYKFPSVTAATVPTASMEATCHLAIESVERFSGDIGKVRNELDSAGQGQEVHVVCQTVAEADRLRELFSTTQLAAQGKLHFPVGRLKAGFRLVPDRIVLVSGSELFHRADLNRTSRRRLGRVIDSFLDLREGDYVVHLAHGIGRYRGLKLLEKGEHIEEHLVIEFADDTKVFVPSTKINLVQKYVGGSKSRPTLAKIGGKTWVRHKENAQQAVTDLAADMIELQAARAARPGISFNITSAWQQEFDASFPYIETPDQATAITAVRNDMHQTRPMDRLLCGDVGFGKTEVAMRAAFTAIDNGHQVAVLVPTTILAEQHLRTFTARMAEFPFTIRALSRFCSPKEERETLAGLKDGSVDIVIGTHRLAQHDIQFQNLGLLIIDEEQRFGVEVKERLKALRAVIDVLTMTATPIPRTLHLSLLGVRDISNLETPPSDRLAVETRVTRFDEHTIRHALLRELNRNGQAFFVHNRIQDIELLKRKLEGIVPEATFEVGHGQMHEQELEDVMLGFVHHKFDVLLATTIVESGLDIPNANTIFIDEADRYGLADLHQLRGRVGRYKHRAYCYLLLPPDKQLATTAAKRLRAIEEFSDMGAGFAIAMRDLELRGAGNILGTQQSGHIAAVGYELYCELLEQAVRHFKHLPPKTMIDVRIDLPGEAYLPRGYVSDVRVKIDLYRRFNRVSNASELADLAAEMLDRFGPRPPQVEHMLDLAGLRIAAHRWGIGSIHREETFAVLRYADRDRVQQLAQRPPKRLRIVDGESAYLPLTEKEQSELPTLLATLKSLLQPA